MVISSSSVSEGGVSLIMMGFFREAPGDRERFRVGIGGVSIITVPSYVFGGFVSLL